MAGSFRVYDGHTTLILGTFASRRAAWLAADEHLLSRLVDEGDWVLGEYLVVREGVAGALDIECQITHLGPAEHLDGCRRCQVFAWPQLTDGRRLARDKCVRVAVRSVWGLVSGVPRRADAEICGGGIRMHRL